MSVQDEDVFDLKLIQMVERNPHLYNKEARDFKDKVKRYKSWENIGKLLGTTGEYCERRWNVLRTRFAKEKRTEKEKISIGVDPDWCPQWPLYKPMVFLSRHVKSRNSYKGLMGSLNSPQPFNLVDVKVNGIGSDESNNNSNSDSNNFASRCNNADSVIMKTEQDILYANVDRSRYFNSLNEEDHSNDSLDSITDETPKHKRRKLDTHDISKNLVSNVKFIADYFKKKVEQESRDSDYAFAKMVHMHLKEIQNTETKNVIKSKIMQCLLNERAE